MAYYASVTVNVIEPNSKTSKTSPKKKKGNTTPKGYKAARSVVSTGIAVATVANSAVGAYTKNKMRQNNISTGLTLAGLVATTAFNPLAGGIAIASYVGNAIVSAVINDVNSTQESNFRQSLRGRPTTSGSRWGGKNV